MWVWGGFVLCLIICGWGLWRGDGANRVGAGIVLVAWCLSLALHQWGNYGGPELPVVVIDIVAMLLLMALSFRSRRIWTLVASALQIATVASHFAAGITHFNNWTYITVTGLLGGYGLLLCMAVAFGIHEVNRKRQGSQTPAPQNN
ncbi:hypothetical protein ABAC460_02250 [Asticcacaulis sp. AC460]|uniref:hypothetical protein n=1 Tax=Asticcacaulis sp. AC460 TaxID=1282360 RepID=UPI0003C40970|nr:hypothetical protein [Asticcacaulis sp. AC460]ESQ93100.1 hypothetical protein ABAC460_02250 [Asticcacaulis sp. AC460]